MFLLNSRVKTLLIILLFAALAAFWHFGFSGLADGDSLYYVRQADVLRTNGLFNTEFPWAYHSAIRENSSSLWYGFSFLLIPFTLFSNLVLGLKIAGVILTTLVLLGIYWLAKRHNFQWPALWPLLTLFSAPNTLFQFLMVRPQTISLALTPLLFSFLINGSLWPVIILSFGIAWAHLNFAWLPVFLALSVLATRWLLEKKIDWLKFAGVAVGVLAGWLARPNPLGAAKLFYIQVVQQILEKQGGLPLLFGAENYPLSASILFTNFLPLLALWVFATMIFFSQKQFLKNAEDKIFLWGTITISTVFFLLSAFVARRIYNVWAEFVILFAAAALIHLWPRKRDAVKYAIAGLLIFLLFFSGLKTSDSLRDSGVAPKRLKNASIWLADNSAPGDIVFNLHWPDFSELFFSNQKNYYINGLDPIFQYAYNPSLYWKYHYLAIDQVTKKTCGAIECASDMLEDTHQVLKRDFNAKYLILSKNENPLVNFYMENDPNYEKKFSEKDIAVYLIK